MSVAFKKKKNREGPSITDVGIFPGVMIHPSLMFTFFHFFPSANFKEF